MRNYLDLVVWQKSHALTLAIYKQTRTFPVEEKYGITSQIRRASASVAANLAEGCGRRSEGEMARFLQIAMGSGAELSYHLLLAKDLNFLTAADYDGLSAELSSIMRMLSAPSQKVRGAAAGAKV